MDEAAQEIGFQKQWDPTQDRIITLDGVDIGWLQTIAQDDALFLAQTFEDRPFQRSPSLPRPVERCRRRPDRIGATRADSQSPTGKRMTLRCSDVSDSHTARGIELTSRLSSAFQRRT